MVDVYHKGANYDGAYRKGSGIDKKEFNAAKKVYKTTLKQFKGGDVALSLIYKQHVQKYKQLYDDDKKGKN